jgi:hypothetical protein
MENLKNENNEKPRVPRPGGNHLNTPAKPPGKKLRKALADLSIIIMIMVVKNNLIIYCRNKPHIEIKGSLKTALSLCNAANFMKTHKSYIVNLNFGGEFKCVYDNYEMQMTNDEIAIIGSDYKEEFNEKRRLFPNIIFKRWNQNKALVT